MSSQSNKRGLDFELNLIPFIDLLSVSICFLLMTAVWLQVGSFEVKQSVGGQSSAETTKKPTLWMNITNDGSVLFEARDSKVPGGLAKTKVAGLQGKPNSEEIRKLVERLRGSDPALVTALIQPNAITLYEDIIEVMDQIKKAGVVSLGVSPL